eukprot:11164546-Lingulodinium_polyedra.AAC.1
MVSGRRACLSSSSFARHIKFGHTCRKSRCRTLPRSFEKYAPKRLVSERRGLKPHESTRLMVPL